MAAYYNEFDPYAAQWLRNLIKANHIAPGDVDERSIMDVKADDLDGYTQCHWFAGIGVWSYALRLASWPDDRLVWTGSCPCQPFSAAGKSKGVNDERHLWPLWFKLIEQCRPSVIFGEQVEASIQHGWLDLVQDNLEGIGYSTGAACIPAGAVGAPHMRQRLWFMAHTDSSGPQGLMQSVNEHVPRRWETKEGCYIQGTVATYDWSWEASTGADKKVRFLPSDFGEESDGASSRVGRLRAYGNAIVPQVAKEVITAYMECRP